MRQIYVVFCYFLVEDRDGLWASRSRGVGIEWWDLKALSVVIVILFLFFVL